MKAIASKGEASSLGDGSPIKDVPFYLYRGENKKHKFLFSRIQADAYKKDPNKWKETIEEKERAFLNRFLTEIEPYRELNHQYHWWCPPCSKDDSFWYMSVMQHFGCPTRLCDFTSDFWTAVFFATDDADDGADMYLYRLRCIHNDVSGNKLPKNSTGNAWFNPNGDANVHNMNELLGYIIGYGPFIKRGPLIQEQLNRFYVKTEKSQMFGWDTPKFQNGRIQQQRGFFVYCVDVKTSLGESINESIEKYGTEFQKFQISASILPEIKRQLHTKHLIEWKVYLDLDRAFKQKQWKYES